MMAVYNVTTAGELATVMSKVTSGDTVFLAPGDYGKLSFYQKSYQSAVTFSASSAEGTVHFDSVNISSSSNITLVGLDIGRALLADEPEYTKMSTIYKSTGIKYVDVSIHGSRDGDVTNDGMGLFVDESADIEILSSNFDELFRGILIEGSIGVTVGGSKFEELRSDGIDAAGSDRVTIRNNTFQAFNRFGSDHADAIQFWNVGQPKGSTDIVVRDNIFLPSADGKGAQGIFISDASPHKFTNVLIKNNLMYGNDDYNGITVTNAVNVSLVGNSVLSSLADPKRYWIRLENSEQVSLAGNVADQLLVTADVKNLVKDGNLILMDTPEARSGFGNLEAPSDARDLIIAGVGYQLPNPGSVAKALGSLLAHPLQSGQELSARQEMKPAGPAPASLLDELNLEAAPAHGQGGTPFAATLSDLLDGALTPPSSTSDEVFSGDRHILSGLPLLSERSWFGFDHFVAIP